MQNLEEIKQIAQKEAEAAKSLAEVDGVYKKYFAKTGKVAELFLVLKDLPEAERKDFGKKVNDLKNELEELLGQKKSQIQRGAIAEKLAKEKIDPTRPSKKMEIGHLHPLTLVQQQCEEIFSSMGFEIVGGPEVETEWYNFDALNIPQDHPARDMWDTFWLQSNQKVANGKKQITNSKNKEGGLLLRTHTSPMQVRYMEKHNPPLRIVVPGRVFRHEATDASHEMQFYQLEGLMVDKNISVANFKAIIEEFFSQFFKRKVKIRLRPSFFPFTEPSFEIDVNWEGDKLARHSQNGDGGWLEVMGAGMVNQEVFKSAGYIKNEWQGFAFGVGIDRLAMIKHKIPDIRLFYQNDLRFLKQF